MTHSSFKNEHPEVSEDNERLEFLGDAILTCISAQYLYGRYPDWPEGELSRVRTKLVDEAQFCHFAQQLKLGEQLRLGKGEQQQNGHQKPSILCGAFEAMIGAYFLDTQQDLQAVSSYVTAFFEPVVVAAANKTILKDHKTPLQEYSQKHFNGAIPDYIEIGCSGPDNNKCYEVEVRINGKAYGQGSGSSKKKAEQAAAKAALETLGVLPSKALNPEG